MFYMAYIGEIIGEWMSEAKMSEGELSRRSGVTQPTIHRIVTGASKEPRTSNVERICKALGRTTQELSDAMRGKRGSPESEITTQDRILLQKFRSLHPDQKNAVLALVESMNLEDLK